MSSSARSRFSSRQCAAARALLAMERSELGALAGLDAEAIELFEAGEELATAELSRIGRALNDAGVIARPATLFAGEGVRVNRP
jgi:hypothetical protein